MDSIPLPKIIFKDVYTFVLSLCTFLLLSSLALLTYFYLIRNYDLFYFNISIFFVTIGLIIWLTRKWYIDIQKPQNEKLYNEVKQQKDDIENTKKLNENITNDIEKLKEENKEVNKKIYDLYSIIEKKGARAFSKEFEEKRMPIGENSDE